MVVNDVRELFHTNHQDVVGGPGANQGICLGHAVAVAGAGGRDIEGGGRGGAEPVGDLGSGRRRRVRVRHRRDQHGPNLGRVNAGALDGLGASGDGHVHHRDVLRGAVAGDDAGALLDPLVGGIDPLAHVLIRDDDRRAVRANAQDRRSCTGGVLFQRWGAHSFPASGEECAASSSRAA